MKIEIPLPLILTVAKKRLRPLEGRTSAL